MSLRDLHSNIKAHMMIVPLVLNNDSEGTPADGNGLDTRGFSAAELLVILGDSGDTLSGSVKFDLKLQHADSDVNASYSAVTDASHVVVGSNPRVAAPDTNGIFATIDDPAEDQKIFRIGYRGPKRFVRVFIDTTGTHTNGTPATVIGLLGNPSRAPTLDA